MAARAIRATITSAQARPPATGRIRGQIRGRSRPGRVRRTRGGSSSSTSWYAGQKGRNIECCAGIIRVRYPRDSGVLHCASFLKVDKKVRWYCDGRRWLRNQAGFRPMEEFPSNTAENSASKRDAERKASLTYAGFTVS
jgi:hypothetical protein